MLALADAENRSSPFFSHLRLPPVKWCQAAGCPGPGRSRRQQPCQAPGQPVAGRIFLMISSVESGITGSSGNQGLSPPAAVTAKSVFLPEYASIRNLPQHAGGRPTLSQLPRRITTAGHHSASAAEPVQPNRPTSTEAMTCATGAPVFPDKFAVARCCLLLQFSQPVKVSKKYHPIRPGPLPT